MKPKNLLTDSFLPVLLVVIVGAFLFSGMPITKEDLVLPTPTPVPGGGGNGGGATPVPNNPAPVEWAISFTFDACKLTPEGNAKPINIDTGGPARGYVSLDVVSGSTATNVATAEFINPSRSYTTLIFPDGKARRLSLFEGGSSANGKWSGGTVRKIKDIPAATCP